jgi:hypothetical protein
MGKNLHSKLHAKTTVATVGLATLFASAKVAKASSGAVTAAVFYGLLPAFRAFVGFCGILWVL